MILTVLCDNKNGCRDIILIVLYGRVSIDLTDALDYLIYIQRRFPHTDHDTSLSSTKHHLRFFPVGDSRHYWYKCQNIAILKNVKKCFILKC